MNKLLVFPLLVSASLASAVTMPTSTMLSRTDVTFVSKAAMGNNFELKAAQLALSMAKSAQVRTYAQKMIADHTKLGADVKAAVMSADPAMKLPAGVSSAQQQMLDQLKAAGSSFEQMYKTQMVTSHDQTYQLFDKYSRKSSANPGLKKVIAGALPTVKMHWDMAKALPAM
ncbi:DUF4142 domain-containing protein [Deinococcus sp.]|uniref:DUF4142 domain-containing protein n=1 Tax=Deinococcus sp. TaxID=47478 RepID=UPI003CC51757